MATQQKSAVAESLTKRLNILIGLAVATLAVSVLCLVMATVGEIRARRVIHAIQQPAMEMRANAEKMQQDMQAELKSLQFGGLSPE